MSLMSHEGELCETLTIATPFLIKLRGDGNYGDEDISDDEFGVHRKDYEVRRNADSLLERLEKHGKLHANTI